MPYNFIPPVTNPMGIFNYSDLATLTTPLAIVGAAAAVDVPNDMDGPQNLIIYPPSGVTRLWDGTDFLFDELSLGDSVELRFNAVVTTSTVNTEITVDWLLAIGGSNYPISVIAAQNFKTTGAHQLTRYTGLYIGDANTRDNPGRMKISSDQDCSLVVSGWYMKVHRR